MRFAVVVWALLALVSSAQANLIQFAAGGGSPIALIAHTVAQSSNNTSVTTGAINTTGANTLVVIVSCFNCLPGAIVSDSNSNTWTQLTNQGTNIEIYYAKNATVGSGHTFTANPSNGFPSIAVLAFSNANASAPFDVENGATSGSSVSSFQPGSVTPSNNNEACVYGWMITGNSSSSLSVNIGTISDSAFNNGHAEAIGAAYQIQTTATAINPTWSWTGASPPSANIACFKQ